MRHQKQSSFGRFSQPDSGGPDWGWEEESERMKPEEWIEADKALRDFEEEVQSLISQDFTELARPHFRTRLTTIPT
jgi:hypothetical protein